MKLVVTIFEPAFERAIEAIRSLDPDHDAIELRAERLGSIDLGQLRSAMTKPIILTYRGSEVPDMAAAIAAGIDFVDVEYRPGLSVPEHRERIVLSHHDYDGMPDVEGLLDAMVALGCAHTKLAVTPRTFEENRRLLRLLSGAPLSSSRLSLIGMGERGLYSRILAPFLGSELMFVSRDDDRSAAPGQISLERAQAIYGDRRVPANPAIFALIGNPAGHSLSPTIHNPRFRERGVDAVYTILSTDAFEEVAHAVQRGEDLAPRGLSITAPFKERAFEFARSAGARVAPNADACGAANTLVRMNDGLLADNTDVDGFTALLTDICGRDRKSVAIIGAGGTARAAVLAANQLAMHVSVFNRTTTRSVGVPAAPLEALTRFDGEVVVNTLGAGAHVPFRLRPGMSYIDVAYGDSVPPLRRALLRTEGVQTFDGLDLLRAQAIRQNDLFVEALR
ncbi:MAG: type I 3-dehydroquinate dehydratase [Thermoanaerobaculia bacterium]